MITLNFKFRQHLIYLVLSIVSGLLIKEGAYLLILIIFVYFKRFPKTYWCYFLVSFLSVGYVNLTFQSLQLDDSQPIYVKEAQVIEVKKQSDERQTAKIKSEAGQFYLTLQASEPKLLPGDWIRVETEVEDVQNPTVPHAFNFKRYLQSNGMRGSLYLTSTEVISHDWSIRQYQHQVANWVTSTFPPLTATYLQSWFLGIRDDLSEEVNESYSSLGIIHLFAVSGLHVSLLLGIIGYVLKRLGIIQELADIILIMIIFVFIILSGASPSIVRAGSMAILGKLNTKFKWKLSSLDIFSIVFLFNFIIFPLQVYQSGFIYSYWLTFCLIICQSFIQSLPSIIAFFIIPLLAQLAILPIQLSQSYFINLMAYFSNLLFIPIVTSLLIPLLLVTLLIPNLAMITEPLIYLFEQLVLLTGDYLNFTWVIGALSITSVTFMIGLLLLMGWGVERKFSSKGCKVILIIIILLIEVTQKFKPTSKVTFLDVGQGDSTVIQSPYQQCNIVVDTGGKVSFTGQSTSIFNQTLKPYLLGEGIRQIDFLILSHGDYDHIGEANQLLKTFDVKYLVIPNDSTSEALSETIQLAKELGIKILSPQTNEVLTCGNQTYTFLQPAAKQESENDQSLVMTLEMDGLSVLLTGDISTKVERDILSNYSLSRLDIYKAAHHGSKTSNSKPFLKELKPAISVISSGENNRYAHPSQEFLTTLSELNIPSLNTQVDGSIQFERYKDETWVNLFY